MQTDLGERHKGISCNGRECRSTQFGMEEDNKEPHLEREMK